MKNLIISTIMAIVWMLFMSGFLAFIPAMALVELLFWIVCDTKMGWFFQKIWDSRKTLRLKP